MAQIKKFSIAARTQPVTPTVEPVEPIDPIVAAMDAAAADLPKLLAPAAVAEILVVTERTLERWRMTGEGPRFVKLSRSTVRYAADDVAKFVSQRLRRNTVA